jgi:hypothetical protein
MSITVLYLSKLILLLVLWPLMGILWWMCYGWIIHVSKKSGTSGNFIYYLHYMLYMFTPTLYTSSQPLYHVCADFAQPIGIDSSTTVCNSLPKVTKISDFNSIHLCLQESPKCKVLTFSSNVNVIFSLLIRKIIKIPIGSRLSGQYSS